MNSTKRTVLLLDDESKEQLVSIHDAFRDASEELEYRLVRPGRFGEEATAILASDVSAVLIDHNLQAVAGSDGTRVEYRAKSLAVELRERMAAESGTQSIPIVLWSVDDKLEERFLRDPYSANPYDWVLRKSGSRDYAAYAVGILVGLIFGYEALSSASSRYELLGMPDSVLSGLDPRLDSFLKRLDDCSVSEAAQLLLHGVVAPNGPLVSESLLAVRLGVEVEKSTGWSELRNGLGVAKYCGPFSDGFARWWWAEVLEFWRRISEEPLRTLSSRERVSRLEGSGFSGLHPITRPEGIGVWHTSRVSGGPLSATTAMQVVPEPPFPWLDRLYVSEDEVVERLAYRDGWRIHPLERGRMSRLATGG